MLPWCFTFQVCPYCSYSLHGVDMVFRTLMNTEHVLSLRQQPSG